jgi:hypothetical protein
MTELTEDQKQFLKLKGINASEVFDATDLKRSEYSKVMRKHGYKVAYGVTPCAKEKHSLRDSSGNCLQCNPLSLAYAKNHNDGGYIYIAQSLKSQLVKIGSTSNIKKRVTELNAQRYGSQTDWEIVHFIHVGKKRGVIEAEVQNSLKKNYVISHYFKNGIRQSTYEVFDCSVMKASSLLEEVVKTALGTTSESTPQVAIKEMNIKKTTRMSDKQREESLQIKHKYAEAWLDEACQLLSDFYRKKGLEIPKVRVLFGFSTSGHKIDKELGNHEGECLSTRWTEDGTILITITPLVERAIHALSILGHELVHAIDNCESDHGSDFLNTAQSVGYDIVMLNKKREIVLSESLHKQFITFAEMLGRFPSIKLKKLNSK